MPSGKNFLSFRRDWSLRYVVFWLAPILALSIALFAHLDPKNPAVTYTLAVAVLMALWWVSEVVPLAVTSMLPIVLFPVLGIMNGKAVSGTYFNHVIFLFIGGFLVALALQKWNLHKRMALWILNLIGTGPARILFGFMFATAFLSMWISNTATAMMMVPILLSIIVELEEKNGVEKVKHFSTGLLLSIAYGASVGGLATLVGTPPNLSFARIFNIYFPDAPEISFSTWFFYAFPISVLMFLVAFGFLYFVFVRKDKANIQLDKHQISNQLAGLGPMKYEEKVLLTAFIGLALLWFFRSNINLGFLTIPGWSNLFAHPKYLNDGTVAILVSTLLFLIPTKERAGEFIMDWKTAEAIPWEIILLFGGGFALASGFKQSGLSTWFGEQLAWIGVLHPILIILIIAAVVTFLTEVTSNTATVEAFLPILAGLAISTKINPLLFMLPATIAGSLAFMLPVATPPNAIVFGTKRLSMLDLAKSGFWLNLAGIIIVTIITYYLGTYVFGIDAGVFPDWAGKNK